MNIRLEVEQALDKLSKTAGFKIAYEGRPFIKPTDAPYVAMLFLAQNATNPTVDGVRIRKRGIFQIECYVPDGRGMTALEDLSEKIVALFPMHRKDLYQTFSVEKAADVSSAYPDGAFRCVVVRVEYRQEF